VLEKLDAQILPHHSFFSGFRRGFGGGFSRIQLGAKRKFSADGQGGRGRISDTAPEYRPLESRVFSGPGAESQSEGFSLEEKFTGRKEKRGGKAEDVWG